MVLSELQSIIPQPSVAHGGHDARCSPTTGILEFKLESIMQQPPTPDCPVIRRIHLIPTPPPNSAIDATLASLSLSSLLLYATLTSKRQKPHNTHSAGLFWKPRVPQGQIAQTQVQPGGFGTWSLSAGFLPPHGVNLQLQLAQNLPCLGPLTPNLPSPSTALWSSSGKASFLFPLLS